MSRELIAERNSAIYCPLSVVSKHFDVSVSDLLSARRHRSVARPRQIAMYLAATGGTELINIGYAFGRNQVSVLMAVALVGAAIETDVALRLEVERLGQKSAAERTRKDGRLGVR